MSEAVRRTGPADWSRRQIECHQVRPGRTVTSDPKNCRNQNMQNQIRHVRLALTALGLWTVTLSFMVIFGAINQLRAWQGDALYDVSIVCLLLGVLLALGGGGLAFRGIKYRSSAR